MNSFYITTPLYYVNDKPHLGSAYSTVVADTLNRYHKLFQLHTHFLTGVDEHGQKVEQAAKDRNKNTQEHCDEMAQVFRATWQKLNIEEDIFFRTTSDFHKKAVQQALQQLFDAGEIYEDTYTGWYCVSEEIFYTEKELVNGKTPTGKDVQKITEKNYFFRMSKYQQQLIDYIEKHPEFIQPNFRKNEVLGFLKKPLADLCLSRPKSRLQWGIEIPFDKDYVTYVWFDALLNYATGVGYLQSDRQKDFDLWWNQSGVVHLLGKDILMTHAVYWPTMLMALGVRLPKTIFAHGWILNKDNEKMSKSKGSVMDPNEWVDTIGADALRYFLINDIPLGHDAPVSQELIEQRVNTDLANNIGNLLSRTTNLVTKFFDGRVPAPVLKNSPHLDAETQNIISQTTTLAEKVKSEVLNLAPHKALQHIRDLLNETNRYLEVKAPWKTAKTDLTAAGENLYVALEVLRVSSALLEPVMPLKMQELQKIIGVSDQERSSKEYWLSLSKWAVLKKDKLVKKPEPLFPRIENQI